MEMRNGGKLTCLLHGAKSDVYSFVDEVANFDEISFFQTTGGHSMTT